MKVHLILILKKRKRGLWEKIKALTISKRTGRRVKPASEFWAREKRQRAAVHLRGTWHVQQQGTGSPRTWGWEEKSNQFLFLCK